MRFAKEFFNGLYYCWEALLFIRKHKLYWYVIFPAILMLGIYQAGNMIRSHVFTSDISTMNDIVWYLIKLFIEISIAILLMNFSKYLVVALLSPLLAFLSMKTEKLISGKTYDFDFQQLISDIKRGVKIVTRNFMWYYFFFVIILIIAFIGWENPRESPVFYLTYLLGFYYYGFSFMDYVNERRKLSVHDSILYIRRHRGLAIALGSIYSLMILVPVNLSALFDWQRVTEAPIDVISQFVVHFSLWICASFAPILASVAATLAMVKSKME
ncbi:MAG: hypothetical protein EP338_11640 [Bacteroidetes bacterium]|nr:MAG: hypothetical protein EP338_11640 [Bacteroidota bacterium]